MHENFLKFAKLVSSDPDLKEKANKAASVEELVALAKENGIEITEQEFVDAPEYSESVELTEEEMNNVSGGVDGVCLCIIAGGGPSCSWKKTCVCIIGGEGAMRNRTNADEDDTCLLIGW